MKVFPKKSESVSETKIVFFKRKCFYSYTTCEAKVFLKRKKNCFQNENVFIYKPFTKQKCF